MPESIAPFIQAVSILILFIRSRRNSASTAVNAFYLREPSRKFQLIFGTGLLFMTYVTSQHFFGINITKGPAGNREIKWIGSSVAHALYKSGDGLFRYPVFDSVDDRFLRQQHGSFYFKHFLLEFSLKQFCAASSERCEGFVFYADELKSRDACALVVVSLFNHA